MTFTLLEQIAVSDGTATRTVSLYEGDLAAIPPDHAVDLLIVSAFPEKYDPTPGTLIAALNDAGVSVAALARGKLHDLRSTTAFWLSQPLAALYPRLNAGQVACFEPGTFASPSQAVGALFRGLFPFLTGDGQSVAMPLLAAGNQGWPDTETLIALLDDACHWLQRGLGIDELKIVLKPSPRSAVLAAAMYGFKAARDSALADSKPPARGHDVFLSYCSADADAAAAATRALRARPDVRSVFDYRFAIEKGASWQRELDKAIASSRSIVALLSPGYFASPECIEELMQGRLRHKRAGGNVLIPVYWREIGAELDLWIQVINYLDCREADANRLASSIEAIGAL